MYYKFKVPYAHEKFVGDVTNILSYMDNKSAGYMSKMDLTQWSQKGAIV
jgi:hypothetical protein